MNCSFERFRFLLASGTVRELNRCLRVPFFKMLTLATSLLISRHAEEKGKEGVKTLGARLGETFL